MKVPEHLLQAIKAGDTKNFYKSRIWRKKRDQILKRDNYECQLCRKEGGVNLGDDGHGKRLVVHHIKYLREYSELALSDENLVTVCEAHHNKLHPEKFEKFRENWEKENKIDIPERW